MEREGKGGERPADEDDRRAPAEGVPRELGAGSPLRGPLAEREDRRRPDDEEKEGKDEVGRRAAVPLGVAERRKDEGPAPRVVHEEHRGDRRPPEEIEGGESAGGRRGRCSGRDQIPILVNRSGGGRLILSTYARSERIQRPGRDPRARLRLGRRRSRPHRRLGPHHLGERRLPRPARDPRRCLPGRPSPRPGRRTTGRPLAAPRAPRQRFSGVCAASPARRVDLPRRPVRHPGDGRARDRREGRHGRAEGRRPARLPPRPPPDRPRVARPGEAVPGRPRPSRPAPPGAVLRRLRPQTPRPGGSSFSIRHPSRSETT